MFVCVVRSILQFKICNFLQIIRVDFAELHAFHCVQNCKTYVFYLASKSIRDFFSILIDSNTLHFHHTISLHVCVFFYEGNIHKIIFQIMEFYKHKSESRSEKKLWIIMQNTAQTWNHLNIFSSRGLDIQWPMPRLATNLYRTSLARVYSEMWCAHLETWFKKYLFVWLSFDIRKFFLSNT